MDSEKIVELYENVLLKDGMLFNIAKTDILIGIESMKDVYKPCMSNLAAERSSVANYNDAAHRCAYLHKYAAFHTAMVRDYFYQAVHTNYRLFYHQVFSHEPYNICCLGGGPGNDVIAVMSVLHMVFSYFPVAATVVDYMESWKYSFLSIIEELGSGKYGAFGNNTYHFLDWRYLQANLLKTLLPEVENSIGSASLVTMIKFASATACKDTQMMMNNIFRQMKPGAMILFIDNDGGGYHELVMNSATKYGFESVFGPLRHEEYVNPDIKIKRFGYVSCHRSLITVHMLMKPVPFQDYHPQNPDFCSYPRLQRRVSLPPTPIANSPLTPYVHIARSQDFTEDESLTNEFSSPVVSPLQNMQLPSTLATPLRTDILNTPYVCRQRKTSRIAKGCLPMNLHTKQLRHRLINKVQNVKRKAMKVLRMKSKKHPVSTL